MSCADFSRGKLIRRCFRRLQLGVKTVEYAFLLLFKEGKTASGWRVFDLGRQASMVTRPEIRRPE
jgi:hypothetical protein